MAEEKIGREASIVYREYDAFHERVVAGLKGQSLVGNLLLKEGKFRGMFKHPEGFVFVGKFPGTWKREKGNEDGNVDVADEVPDYGLADNNDNVNDDNNGSGQKARAQFCPAVLVTAHPETGEIVSRSLKLSEWKDMHDQDSIPAFHSCKDMYCRIRGWSKTPHAIVLFSPQPLGTDQSWVLVKRADVWSGVLSCHKQDDPGWKFQDLMPHTPYVTLTMFPQYTVKEDRVPVIDCRK